MEKNSVNPLEILLGYIFKDDEKSEEVSTLDFLARTPFFKRLNRRQLKRVLQTLHVRTFREGEFLFEFGNPGAALFLVQEGEVSIEIPQKTSAISKVVTTVGANTFLGEIALLNNDERSASAKALKTTKTLALYRNDLLRMTQTEPEIASEIYRSLAQVLGKRLMATTKMINEQKKDKVKDVA